MGYLVRVEYCERILDKDKGPMLWIFKSGL